MSARKLLIVSVATVLVAAAIATAVAFAAAMRGTTTPAQSTVAAGGNDSLLVKPDGTLWSWGANNYGELGLGDTTPRSVPTQVGSDTDWKIAAAGANGCVKFAIKQNGTLWTWGDNEAYYLTGGGGPPVLAPTQVGSDTDWAAVAVGSHFALAVKTGGTLWAWGDNDYGQLGLNDTSPRATFTQVGSDADWKTVACGRDHSAALKTTDALYVWGGNLAGQLGTGDKVDVHQPTPLAGTWQAVACGTLFTLGIKTTGTLWTWGDNYFGALGKGDYGPGTERLTPGQVGSDSDWTAVDGGEWHSVALKSDHTLWGWGDNGYGALGPALTNMESGWRITLTPTQLDAATDWGAVSCGDLYTLAEKQDGSFFSWGDNSVGQLGVGYPLARHTPEQLGTVGGWVSVASGPNWGIGIRDDGTMWGWGHAPGLADGVDSRAPLQIGAARDWQKIFGGRYSVLAIKNDLSLWAWGSNDNGELGLGDTESRQQPTRVGNDTGWTDVACGGAAVETGTHTLALKTDGTLWAWGANSHGELGIGSTTEKHSPQPVSPATFWRAIAAGGHCSYAINASNQLWAWGKNASGELGLGDAGLEPHVPQRVGSDSDWNQVAVADDAGMVGPNQEATNFVVAVKTGHTLWSWGSRESMGLGQPNGAVFNNLSPAQVGSDSDWASVAVGDEINAAHGLAIKTDDTLWAWGRNSGGSLGTGDYRWRFTPEQVGTDTHWVTANAGLGSSCIKDDGTLWTWGWNDVGQLGLGDPLWHPEPVDLVLTGDGDVTAPTVEATPGTGAGTPAPVVSARIVADHPGLPSTRPAAWGWYRVPVTVKFTASDGGWGIARTQYTLNGGIGWRTASAVRFKTSGKRTFTYDAVDRAHNTAAPKTIVFHVDLLRPVPKALNAPVVRRSANATLKFSVADKYSPSCAVKIVVRNAAGKVMKTMKLGMKPSGRKLSTTVRCAWAAGRYRWLVYATDLAGNTQKTPASRTITVK